MKKFDQFIAEEGEVANTTAGVQNYQSPIGTPKPTAKKKVVEGEEFEVDSNAKKISGVTPRGV